MVAGALLYKSRHKGQIAVHKMTVKGMLQI
jgi:hypothetical protein